MLDFIVTRNYIVKLLRPVVAALLLALLGASFSAQAADPKRGRVYYRMVCTICHMEKAGGPISPSTRTKAEWTAYFLADKHAKGKDSLAYYIGKPYRASIKGTNKAAEKYAEIPDHDLTEDIKAFVNQGAKDSDTPTSCD